MAAAGSSTGAPQSSRDARHRQALEAGGRPRYRTGAEGRISHLKRGYGLRRSRLKGDDGQKTWTGWAILVYNLDTLNIRSA
jgi:IS5 family transposase